EVTMAVDYGTARVGVAVSAGLLARPVEVIPNRTPDQLLAQLQRLARDELVTRWLVGLPTNADGSEGEQAAVSREFAQWLADAQPLPVFLWDEHGSSQQAQAQMIAAGMKQKRRKEMLDAWAAAQFLQQYVDRDGWGVEQVWPLEGEKDG
ncbi:MAG: Holliday junction resolvase RuvX, partial [Anaerolineales bacterium]|nr:Holliday junction resolvase RuvX [Anaerolineales bacterium]